MQENDGLFIDLGKYLETLLRQWLLILVAFLVCAVAAAAVALSQPPSYESSALVVSTKVGSVVTFGSTIEFLSEGQGYTNIIDRKARLQTYVTLVKSPLIAERVYEDLRLEMGDSAPLPKDLLSLVSGSLISGTDTIKILVRNNNPEMTQKVAEAWARRYVEFINQTYSTGGTEQAVAAIQAQIDQAYQDYLAQQEAYVSFLSASPIDEIARMIEQMLALDRLLYDATTLREQVRAGGEASVASNAAAVAVLKIQAFVIMPDLREMQVQVPVQVQVTGVEQSLAELLRDLDSLVQTLEGRLQSLEGRVAGLAERMGIVSKSTGLDEILSNLGQISGGDEDINYRIKNEQSLRYLLALQEYENGNQLEKQLARDLAWQTYSNLTMKEGELVVAAQTGGQEVTLGAPPVLGTESSSLIQPVLLAAGVGLLLGMMAAFAIEYWWSYKGIPPQAIFRIGSRKSGA